MKNSMWYCLTLCFLCFNEFRMIHANVYERSGITRTRGARKLFGGYRITPKFCKATRPPLSSSGGPNICMFNHECTQRNGEVVGACMDGFLFGACCQLPEDAVIGETVYQDYANSVTAIDNTLSSKITPTTHRTTPLYMDLTSNSVSQITAALLNSGNPPFSGNDGPDILPNGDDSAVVNVAGDTSWSTTGITHQQGVETEVNDKDNEINASYFSATKEPPDNTKTTSYFGDQTTMRYADTYPPPILQISVSNAPIGYTPLPTIQRPLFRPKPPKPTGENYILVPTLTHESSNPDQTDNLNSIVNNIINSFNQTTTGRPLSTFSYVSSSSSATSSRRPATTTRKPPSTSYIFSTTIPPRRTEATTSRRTTTKYSRKPTKTTVNTNKYSVTTVKPPSTSYVYSSTFKPTSRPNSGSTGASGKPTSKPKPISTSYVYSSTYKPTKAPVTPSNSYVYGSTLRPGILAHSTFANTPDAFVGSQTTPSYIYGSGSTGSTYRPPSTVNSNVGGLGFTVTSQPVGQYSPFPSPAPTLIVLGAAADDNNYVISSNNGGQTGIPPTRLQSPTTTARPPQLSPFPEKKPINHITINNHVTQNIYSTQRPQTSSSSQKLPSPTVIITPKPTISSSYSPLSQEDFDTFVVTSANDMVNFPPDRNPNLNLSMPIYTDEDITTPHFIEDEAMNETVESFVNQIIYGLQEPFNDLKDIVYNNNFTATASGPTTKKPTKKQGTTKKPITKPNSVKTTTRRPVPTRRPASSSAVPTRRQTTTTTKRPVTTRKAPTTVQNLIETETENDLIHQNYKDQCGIRPLYKTGRIVGGKGANFGDFPWQVLVRESTWLGLFTKNKCGGVLISDKYVMTAAHCQPGFLASLVAVFGEFDISGDLESRKPTSRNVKRVIVHRKYDAATFENDLALLELESPVKFDAHIIPICLPPENADFTGRVATVTGWGRLKYGGGVPSVLQEVQVPIMENHVCQEMFRTAGHSKVIMESFLCAGYANGQKDSCEGDSGGPLVLQRPDGRYQLAGTVSHGIKCAAPYLPGVYMRTTFYKPWITSITGIE